MTGATPPTPRSVRASSRRAEPGAPVPSEQIDVVRATDIPRIARRYTQLKRTAANEWAGPCRICGGRNRFSVNTRKQAWNCRGCSKGGDVISLVRHALGMGFAEAIAELTGETKAEPMPWVAVPYRIKDAEQKSRSALRIWREAYDPRRTPVEAYLASRGLALPEGAAGEALRFHPRCPFGRERTPAMVALVRDIRTNEPIAIHRTALDPYGTKRAIDGKDRMMLGPARGGVVKLTPDADVSDGRGVGEGIESVLSLQRVPDWAGGPDWACLSAGSLADFPVLDGIQTLVVAVDNNAAGTQAAARTVMRWHDAGRATFVIMAKRHGDDLNDLVCAAS